MTYKILELYSGIGGMHCAWNETGLPGEIVAAVDVNTVANEVYKHQFPATNVISRNIQSFTPKEIDKLNINTILMSPPCQPFTRNGKYLDENDPRSNSFIHLIDILEQLENIEYILMENVKGFECSAVRKLFIDKLKICGYEYQEFLLCPTTVGVPNFRLRYYCIARRSAQTWNFERKDEIITKLPKDYGTPPSIDSILENNVSEKFLIPTKLLKWAKVFDFCYRHSMRSSCFTKAYTHYVDGTGSVYCEAGPEAVELCIDKANSFEVGSEEFIECFKDLKLRYFTPKEVSSLMSFPQNFTFPESITLKQCYRLLGNSVNVKVISELLKILFDE